MSSSSVKTYTEMQGQCMVDATQRQICGGVKTKEIECKAEACCWQPTDDQDAPWCYATNGTAHI